MTVCTVSPIWLPPNPTFPTVGVGGEGSGTQAKWAKGPEAREAKAKLTGPAVVSSLFKTVVCYIFSYGFWFSIYLRRRDVNGAK